MQLFGPSFPRILKVLLDSGKYGAIHYFYFSVCLRIAYGRKVMSDMKSLTKFVYGSSFKLSPVIGNNYSGYPVMSDNVLPYKIFDIPTGNAGYCFGLYPFAKVVHGHNSMSKLPLAGGELSHNIYSLYGKRHRTDDSGHIRRG